MLLVSAAPSATYAQTSSDAEGDGSALGTPQPSTMRVIVVESAPYGVDPVVGQHVTAEMRETAAAMGYDVVSPEDTVAAARSLPMPFPPSPADLWRVTYVARVQRGAFARVWANAGQYVIEVTVASLDGTGPFHARGTSTADGLHAEVERLVREALPPTERWDAAAAARLAQGTDEGSSGARSSDGAASGGSAPMWSMGEAPRSERRTVPSRRFDLAIQTEGAVGTSSDRVYNHLVGLRLGFRIRTQLLLGLYFGYVNLTGRDGRVSNMLALFQVENRIRFMAESDVTVPIRVGIGYLPYNGPVIRVAGGLNIPLGERVELGFDIVTPTFWFTQDETIVTLDVATEVIFRL
jgi:hypothetical protein